MSMADFLVDIQVYVISKITHSSVRYYRLRLQRGFNFWLLIQLLSPKSPSDISPPVFARNYHHSQPTVLSVGIGLDLREMSISDCWESYHWPTDQILPNIPPPGFARNYHQAQPTVLSIGIGSDVTKVSIADCWDSYYRPNLCPVFHPLFSRWIVIRRNPQVYPLE